MAGTEELPQELYREMLARILEDDVDVPFRKGSHFYYRHTEKSKSYPIHCRKTSETPEGVLLDENKLAEAAEFTEEVLPARPASPLKGWMPSAEYLAVYERENGAQEFQSDA